MDRGRCFSMLGLTERATKEQVRVAYERRVAKYKGPDYAEEPQYARKKLNELYLAYQEAYQLAGRDTAEAGASRFEREADQSRKKKRSKASRLLEEERDAAERNPREKFHQWMEYRDEKKNQRSADHGKSFKKSKKSSGLHLPNLKKPNFSSVKKKLNEVFPDNEIFQEDVLSQKGKTKGEKTKNGQELASAIISIVLTLAVFSIGSCEGDNADFDYDYNYDDAGFSYIYDEDYEDIKDADWEVTSLADESYYLLIEQPDSLTATIEEEDESEYQEEANLFAKNYWGKDSIPEVTQYLYDTYGSYMTNVDEPLSVQLDSIFYFYDFADLEIASWYAQPYTGENIQGYGDYLEYLNQFYEEQ